MSEADERPHLWMSDEEERRYFLVPVGAELAAGTWVLHDLQLATRHVDADAMAAFEVDLAVAQAHVDAGWGRVVGKVRDVWRELLGQPERDDPPDLASWLGVSPGQGLLDRDRRREGRRSLLEKAGSLFGGWSDEGLDKTEERLDRIGSVVRRDARKLRTDLGRLGEELEARAPDVERAMEQAGEALVGVGQEVSDRLRGQRRAPGTDEAEVVEE